MKNLKLTKYAILLMLCIFIESCDQRTNENVSSSQAGYYNGKIRAGHLVALDMAPLFIAKEKGYFKEEKLDLETVFFSNPGDNNSALAGGSIQFSTNPFTLPYFGENSGVPMRIISSAGGLGIIEVIIQGQFNIKTTSDFVNWIKSHPDKKLRIAVLKGDTLEMIVQKMLSDHGLDYGDVEMVWFNDLLAMVQAFQTDQVDVLSHIKPYTTDLVVNKKAVSLTNNSEIWGYGTPNCTVAVLEGFANNYPETVKGYLRALRRGFRFIIDNPKKAAEILDKGNYYKVDKKVLVYAFENQPKEVVLKPNKDGMMKAINALVEVGYIKEPKKDIVLTSFLEELNSK